MLDRLARFINRHPWTVVITWIIISVAALAVALGGVLGQGLFDRTAAGVVVPGEAQDGADLLARSAVDGPVELLILNGGGNDVRTRAAFNAARADLRKIRGVKQVHDPWEKYQVTTIANPKGLLAATPFIADDAKAALMVVILDKGLPVAEAGTGDPAAGTQQAVLEQVRARLKQTSDGLSGTTALVSGPNDIVNEVTEQVETDLRTGEGVALPLSLLIMVVVFGGFLAAGLPILGAIASIAGAMATLYGFSYVIDLDASTINVVTVLGLGLCIDYGLLLVSRYREEMINLPGDPHLPPTRRQRELALRRTMTSAGRTVTFSGVTVAISLTGLMCFRAGFLKAIGAAGVSVVVVAMLVALTLVPALLSLVKVRMIRPGLVHRVPIIGRIARSLGDATREEGFFSKLARMVQRYPLIVVLGVLSTLFVLSLPVLRIQLVSSGVQLLPEHNHERELFDNLQQRFEYASTPAIQVVIPRHVTSTEANPNPYVTAIEKVPAVSVDAPAYQGTKESVTVLNVRVDGSDSSPIALNAVREIRSIDPGYPTYVTGNPALLVDYLTDLKERAPLAVGVVVLATFVLLFLMTGSVLVPVKALAMNVVSLGACIGVIVWVFQDGNLQSLLMFSSTGGVETFIPPLTLAFGFGLAMDYEVFLLSRIAEYRNQGYSNDDAVALGLQRSGRIISSAALIVVVVFLGFVAGQLLIIKETGLSLAVAVAIDATLVRMLLVPATMTLLGEWNWWAPPFLRRLHDRYGISE